jgi:hypothetical protein
MGSGYEGQAPSTSEKEASHKLGSKGFGSDIMAEEPEGFRLFEFIRRRRSQYKQAKSAEFVITAPATQNMLIDLADFCRAAESCVVIGEDGKVDEARTLIMEGRHEVWLRLQNHFNLTTEQLYRLATGKQFETGDTDDR